MKSYIENHIKVIQKCCFRKSKLIKNEKNRLKQMINIDQYDRVWK